jgi:hypothetical protein
MPMFAFSCPILLMCVRTAHMMGYANALKKRIKPLVFAAAVGLHSNNFLIKLALNKILKVMKFLKNV